MPRHATPPWLQSPRIRSHALYNGHRSTKDQTILSECKDSCNECLRGTHQFSACTFPSRLLATKWLELIDQVVPASPDWDTRVKGLLSTVGRATLVAQVSQMRDVVSALHSMLADEIERDYLLLPIVIESVIRKGRQWRITVILSEVPNA